MKRIIITTLAVALLLTMFCATAMASHGDLTMKAAKLYANPAMTEYVGTIPAYTALVVRSNDSYTDVYINGRVYYVSDTALLNRNVLGDYVATLDRGTTVYQRANTGASRYTLKKNCAVQICKVRGEWALIHTLSERGLYAFVKVEKLKNITKI